MAARSLPVELPPGPGAPQVWQTIARMTRPGAFLQRVHGRFGDPATIRTYWTEEPMVLFSHPDAVREIFRLDPAIAPAGQSWEFLRPFAGEHSILLLDGAEHLRERRLLQAPFHGERMRAFRPLVAELWLAASSSVERPRRRARADAAAGARDHSPGRLRRQQLELEVAQLRDAIEGHARGSPLHCHGCWRWWWFAATSARGVPGP